MDEAEAIRMRKLQQLQQQMQERQQEETQLQAQMEQLDAVIKQKLSKEALIRYGNIKVAHPELAVQLMLILAQAIQQQNIQTITDQQLKALLEKLLPKKREIKIRKV